MRFIDEAVISVRSGHGGRGCVSFRREKFIPKGGPDGGDGGQGGDVWFEASADLLTLHDFKLKRRYTAENGHGGMGAQCYGRAGEDLVIKVPVGTLIHALPSPVRPAQAPADDTAPLADDAAHSWGVPPPVLSWRMDEPIEITEDFDEELPPEDEGCAAGCEDGCEDDDADGEDDFHVDPTTAKGELVADLDVHGKRWLAARGGRGGKGNLHFKSATMRAPRFAQPGETGQELTLRLELKILADVGIIGLPNAGKSTLIAAASRARPKIANYPFTTLTPNLGVVLGEAGQRFVMADIPGLIEGAHLGQGLGVRFLKHVERTRVLVHMLSVEDMDLTALEDPTPQAGDPWAGFRLVDEELRAFNPVLMDKPQIRVVNKVDLLSPEQLAALRARALADGMRVLFLSALEKKGLRVLLQAVWDMLEPHVTGSLPGSPAPPSSSGLTGGMHWGDGSA